MARLVFTSLASGDEAFILEDLHRKAGLPTAAKFRSLFAALYDRLADHPRSGHLRPALGAHVRIGIVAPYLVVYEHVAHAETVTILRVIHGSQDITLGLLSGRQ